MSVAIKKLKQGASLPIDRSRAAMVEVEFTESVLARQPSSEPRPVSAARADYSAGYNSTSLTPNGPSAGVEASYGRIWAEARSITHSGGSGSVAVALLSTQNGVRAIVTAPAGQTITGGSVRFWNFDPVTQIWALGGVDETLSTGTQSVATSDQFMTVGAQ